MQLNNTVGDVTMINTTMNNTHEAICMALTEQSVLAGSRSTTPRLFGDQNDTTMMTKLPYSVTTTSRTMNQTLTPNENEVSKDYTDGSKSGHFS